MVSDAKSLKCVKIFWPIMSFGKTGIKSYSKSRGSLSASGRTLWFFKVTVSDIIQKEKLIHEHGYSDLRDNLSIIVRRD